jgi:hypothetical protein
MRAKRRYSLPSPRTQPARRQIVEYISLLHRSIEKEK